LENSSKVNMEPSFPNMAVIENVNASPEEMMLLQLLSPLLRLLELRMVSPLVWLQDRE
jgi:hypothetical protein